MLGTNSFTIDNVMFAGEEGRNRTPCSLIPRSLGSEGSGRTVAKGVQSGSATQFSGLPAAGAGGVPGPPIAAAS